MRCRLKFGLCVVGEMIKIVWHKRLKQPLISFVLHMIWMFGFMILASVVAIGLGKLWSLLLGDFYWSFSVWFFELNKSHMMMQYWMIGIIILFVSAFFVGVLKLIIGLKREIIRSIGSVVKECKDREHKRDTR